MDKPSLSGRLASFCDRNIVGGYILRRLLSTLILLFVVSVIIFLTVHVLYIEGRLKALRTDENVTDWEMAEYGGPLTEEQWRDYKEEYLGLGDSLLVRYGEWMGDFFLLDQRLVLEPPPTMFDRLGHTLPPFLLALVAASVFGTLLGVATVHHNRSIRRYLLSRVSLAGTAIPLCFFFLLGLVAFIILVFNKSFGNVSSGVLLALRDLFLPALLLAVPGVFLTATRIKANLESSPEYQENPGARAPVFRALGQVIPGTFTVLFFATVFVENFWGAGGVTGMLFYFPAVPQLYPEFLSSVMVYLAVPALFSLLWDTVRALITRKPVPESNPVNFDNMPR